MAAHTIPVTVAQVAQVVVGVDGSQPAHEAALWAADEAAARAVPLTVVHALGVSESIAPSLGPVAGQGREPSEADLLLAATLQTVHERRPGLPATVQLSALAPAERLVSLSGPDTLIVVGTRGHGALLGLLVGSVSRALVKHTRGPLVVVRAAHTGRHGGPVLLGIGAHPDPAAAHFAFETAQRYGTDVQVVRTHPPLPPSPAGPGTIDLPVVMPAGGGIRSSLPARSEALQQASDDAAAREESLAETATAAARAGFPRVKAKIIAVEGDAALTLTARSQDASLVVLGAPCRRHRGPLALNPGHVTGKLLAHSPAPIAVIPATDPQAPQDTDTAAGAGGVDGVDEA